MYLDKAPGYYNNKWLLRAALQVCRSLHSATPSPLLRPDDVISYKAFKYYTLLTQLMKISTFLLDDAHSIEQRAVFYCELVLIVRL